MRRNSVRAPLSPGLLAALCCGCATGGTGGPEPAPAAGRPPTADAPTPDAAVAAAPFPVALPEEGLTLEMVPIRGGEVDGKAVAPFWISQVEVSWDAFDLFLYDVQPGTDAVTRPSVPYISVDRGFGHEGWPVLSTSPKGARAFCEWLSALTGGSFRLPTEDEWRLACGARPEDLDAHAWHAGNSGGKTHRLGEKLPNEHGVHDMLGNVAEWCVGADGRPLVAGGSFRTDPAELAPDVRQRPTPAWNASDPQIPKSVWWYADANFVGLRVVCDAPPPAPASRP